MHEGGRVPTNRARHRLCECLEQIYLRRDRDMLVRGRWREQASGAALAGSWVACTRHTFCLSQLSVYSQGVALAQARRPCRGVTTDTTTAIGTVPGMPTMRRTLGTHSLEVSDRALHFATLEQHAAATGCHRVVH